MPTTIRWGLRALVWTAPLLLAGCVPEGVSFLTPAGPVAAAERSHLFTVTLITLVVVAPVLIGTPLLIWRYRHGTTRAAYRPDWEFSAPLEVAMWGIPALIVAVLGWQLARETLHLDPYAPLPAAGPAVKVEAIGLNWKWLFLYPDLGIASLNELALPAGTPVAVDLTSDTVMQSFFVSALGGQVYAMPGMTTRMNFAADHPGTFRGDNTQFSGPGFQHQTFTVNAMTTTDFDAWVAKVRADGTALDAAAYATLAKASIPTDAARSFAAPNVPAGTAWFGKVEPGLFDRVLARYMSGDPLPPAAQPGSPSYAGTPPRGAAATGGN